VPLGIAAGVRDDEAKADVQPLPAGVTGGRFAISRESMTENMHNPLGDKIRLSVDQARDVENVFNKAIDFAREHRSDPPCQRPEN